MGVLTGKSTDFGGSKLRPEATGYGLVYITLEALKKYNHYRYLPENRRAGISTDCFNGLRVLISGSGNVAQFAAEKVLELGGIVCSFSDSTGSITSETGFTRAQLTEVCDLKNVKRGRLSELSGMSGATYHAGKSVWQLGMKCDIALPCATQNEITVEGARNLVQGGCWCVAEGANMPTTNEAVEVLKIQGYLYIPCQGCQCWWCGYLSSGDGSELCPTLLDRRGGREIEGNHEQHLLNNLLTPIGHCVFDCPTDRVRTLGPAVW
eukprot:sb/3479466/